MGDRADRIALGIAGAVLGASGYGFLLWVNWRVAVGVFLATWGASVSRDALHRSQTVLEQGRNRLRDVTSEPPG